MAVFGLASATQAQPDARGTSAGVVLQESERGTGAASKAGTAIGDDAAAVNYPTVDSAFAASDGIQVPDAANQSPGQQHLTDVRQDSVLLTGAGDVRLSRLIGTGVFTPAGEQLGAVRDVMLSGTGEPQVVVEANGRNVEVPWSKLAFGSPDNLLQGRVVLPGETPHGLEELPEFDLKAARGNG